MTPKRNVTVCPIRIRPDSRIIGQAIIKQMTPDQGAEILNPILSIRKLKMLITKTILETKYNAVFCFEFVNPFYNLYITQGESFTSPIIHTYKGVEYTYFKH